jgi:branched-chain amino acid transport system ATP-binding protein
MSDDFVLHGRDLTVAFGGMVAVDKLSISVSSRSVTGLVGPNGAGKTTVLNLLSGYYATQSGSISIETAKGQVTLTHAPVEERARLGIGRTFQTPKLFQQMKVWENVVVAQAWREGRNYLAEFLSTPGVVRRQQELRSQAVDVLEQFSLQDKADFVPSQLSLGEQRLIEISRAIFGGSRLILLDEPFAGLSREEKERLSTEIIALRSKNVGVLLIEHNLEVVRRLADHLVIMSEGRELLRGEPEQVLRDPQVVEVFLGKGQLAGIELNCEAMKEGVSDESA